MAKAPKAEPEGGTRGAPQWGRAARIACFLALAGVLVLRDPTLFTAPRFFAEEGVFYFRNAATGDAWAALSQTPKGYLSLFANVAAWLAALAPLHAAPLVTTLFAAAVQLAILAFVVWGPLPFLRSTPARLLIGLALLYIGQADAIWLNSISLHAQLPVLTLLILLDRRGHISRAHTIGTVLLLLFAGLEGVTSCVLVPLFGWRFWRSRSRLHGLQFAALGAAAALQLALVASAPGLDDRLHATPDALTRLAHQALVFPIWRFAPSGLAWWSIALATAVLLVGAWRLRGLRLQLAAYALLIAVPFALSLNMQGGPRYAYAGAICLVVLQLRLLVTRAAASWLRSLAGALIVASFAGGLHGITHEFHANRRAGAASWAAEVERWQADPYHWLVVEPWTPLLPRPAWRFQLRPEVHAASPAAWDPDQLFLPVVTIPAAGNYALSLRRLQALDSSADTWITASIERVPDDWPAVATVSADLRELSFSTPEGQHHTFEILERQGPGRFRLRHRRP